MKKIIGIIFMVMVLFLLGCTSQSANQSLKVGAILPLSGPASIWGDSTKNGLDMAQQELANQGINIEIIYEDSQAKPAQGVTAYHKLKNVNDVDVVFSIFSSVSVPLTSLIDDDETPLIMSVVAAKAAPLQSKYAFRHYSTEKQYVDPHFAIMDPIEYDKIAVLYQEGDFGNSVEEAIRAAATEQGIEVVIEESFEAGATDFRTQLTKIKAQTPKAILFVASLPPEVVNILTQIEEIGIETQVIEASAVLSSSAIRASAGDAAEGVWTTAFPFTLERTGANFRQEYNQLYGSDPLFAAALAYDSMYLIAEASGGNAIDGDVFVENMQNIGSFVGTNGEVLVQQNGEINPTLYSARIVNEQLVMN